jgi:glucoamylase
MPRDIPIANGRLLITFDSKYQIRDFYFPHPGRENQSVGGPFKFGVWADGNFSWVDSDDWSRQLKYRDETLVTEVLLRSDRLGLALVSNDAVDFHENVFLRRLVVHNLTDRPRDVRVFFHQDFHISESAIGDTAYYDPSTSAMVHYKRNRYFLAGCKTDAGDAFDQWATGTKEFGGSEGTWRDAEDGSLQGNPIAQGSVDSTLGISLKLEPNGQGGLSYWIAAGKDHHEVRAINHTVADKSPQEMVKRTDEYWRAWVNKEEMNFAELPASIIESFKRSLLLIRTNLDDNGAILAANDSDIETFNGDTYSYVWPRDGALTAYALDVAGFAELTRRFYTFMKTLITPDGYFLHKYTPDGTLGSSWHPWVSNGVTQLPIQEDETALILWGLWKHYNEHRDIEFISGFYREVIKRAADFMVEYRDSGTGLPLPSWDLWEERRGIHTYTVCTVWAGLQAAARFANLFGEHEYVAKYVQAAGEVKQALVKYLYLPQLGRFARSINGNPFVMLAASGGGRSEKSPPKGGTTSGGTTSGLTFDYDTKIDASILAVSYFGVLEPDDPMTRSTADAVRNRLWVKTQVGGLARYEDDHYHQVSQDVERVPGNPWFVCTLWAAEYDIATAQSKEELQGALDLIEWTTRHALPSGVLSEQVDPFTDAPLSVSPLTWSHAQLVTTVMEYLEKLRQLGLCVGCSQPLFDYVRRDAGVIPPRLHAFDDKLSGA